MRIVMLRYATLRLPLGLGPTIIALALCFAPGCKKQTAVSTPPEPAEVTTVKASMDASCTYKNGPADVRPSKKNVGTVVQLGPAIYLVRDGTAFAGNPAAKKCSPKLQETKDLTPQDLDS